MFTPLHDRVLVRPIEEDAKTSGGLIIPDSAQGKPQKGEVVSVGAGAKDEPALAFRWTSKPETKSCSANGPDQKSRSTAKSL